MNSIHISKRGIAAFATAALAALVLVACGGGGSDSEPAPLSREEAQLLIKLPVSWSPQSLTFSLNPGGRLSVPVTLTTTKALANAKIVFVPDLRNTVTVSPETIPALAAGQSVTVTLTFAPATSDTRKFIAGIALLYDKSTTTISRPLPVQVTLIKPEVVNGIALPPDPPADLNNATLAGFDSNGNGVRDDVERQLNSVASGSADFANAVAYAKTYQRLVTDPTPVSHDSAVIIYSQINCASTGISSSILKFNIRSAVVNTAARADAYAKFHRVLGGIFPEEMLSCI